jgi:hypothetical protein
VVFVAFEQFRIHETLAAFQEKGIVQTQIPSREAALFVWLMFEQFGKQEPSI